jgi:hypothetical protein
MGSEQLLETLPGASRMGDRAKDCPRSLALGEPGRLDVRHAVRHFTPARQALQDQP